MTLRIQEVCPWCNFRAGKMHVAFHRRLSWALSVSRNLRLYVIFIKESHRSKHKSIFENQTSILAASPTRPQQRDTCPNAFWGAGLMHSDSSPCKFSADLVLCRSKRRGYGAPEAHPNAFTEPAKMHLAMLPLVFSCNYKKE